jgi:thymidylate synthase (FAD)
MRSCYSSKPAHKLFLDKEGFPESEVRRMIKKALELGHLDVLEHGSLTFSMEGVSRSLTHQLVRHRIASYSQQSQRHVAIKKERPWYIAPPSLKGEKGKFRVAGLEVEMGFDDFLGLVADFYESLLDKVRKEDARFVLPNATTSNITMTTNPRELRHIFSLRCDMAAQWEIRDVCWAMLSLSYMVAPTIFSTLDPPAGNVKESVENFVRMKEGVDAQREGFLRAGRGEVVELDLSNLVLEHPVKAYLIKQ